VTASRIASSDGYRQTTALMRFALILGAVLTFFTGVQLFVLTERTDELFAWTIEASLTATIIGAFYWTACVLAYLSWRRQPWVRARVGIPGVALFLWATLVTTVIHLDRFHLDSDIATARLAAWAWLIIYIADPILVSVAWLLQGRVRGNDPPRTAPLAPPSRVFLIVSGSAAGGLGLVMLLAPSALTDAAGIPLTPLTSRTVGAWVVAMGAVFVTMAWEDDRDRIRPAAIASLVASVLLLVGTVRYAEQVDWGPGGWIYVVLIGSILVSGMVGVGGAAPAPRRDQPRVST
jgi:hypothetical protein